MSEDRNMACSVPEGDLIDLAWGKLEAARAEEVLRHTTRCAECTAELEALKAARESIERAGEVVPSVGFHERLMERVSAAAGVRRATPPSGIHVAGPATKRYAKIVERERQARSWVRPRWKLLVLATAAAACLSFVMLSDMWVFDDSGPPDEREAVLTREQERRAVQARYSERRTCESRSEAELDGAWLDLAAAVGEGEILGADEIILAGVEDPREHEKCLMAFRAEDWEAFSLRHEGAPGGRFEAIASSKRVVPVAGGRIEIPADLLRKHIDGTSVVILKLGDRTEIWSPRSLRTYLELQPFDISIEDLTLAPPSRLEARS